MFRVSFVSIIIKPNDSEIELLREVPSWQVKDDVTIQKFKLTSLEASHRLAFIVGSALVYKLQKVGIQKRASTMTFLFLGFIFPLL